MNKVVPHLLDGLKKRATNCFEFSTAKRREREPLLIRLLVKIQRSYPLIADKEIIEFIGNELNEKRENLTDKITTEV